MLQTKATLKAKTPIKKVSGKPVRKKPKTVAWYKKEARVCFNRAVKYRDSEIIDGEWIFNCITCDKPVLFKDRDGHFQQTAHAGHFQPETRGNTRFNELNVNGQCNWCNSFNAGEQIKYARALDLKYGDGTAKELERLAHIPHQWTKEELLEIIKDAKTEVEFYEKDRK